MATPDRSIFRPTRLSAEIRELGRALGDVIVKLEGREILELEEKLRLLAKSSRGRQHRRRSRSCRTPVKRA